MFSLKALLSTAALYDNNNGLISKYGEVTPQSLTYAKDVKVYSKHECPEVVLNVFDMRRDATLKVDLPGAIRDHILTMSQWLLSQSVFGSITTDPVALIRSLQSEFPLMDNVTVGNIIKYSPTNATAYMPEWISWKFLGAGENNILKVWLSDDSFQNQYDLFEIDVIPPVDDLDRMFDDFNHVAALINARTITMLMSKINTKANEHPYTVVRTEAFRWTESGPEPQSALTDWTYLIYGAGGNNIDSIKEASIKYILANSTHTRDEWAAILPDIFKSTEIIITPLWDQYSVPNRTLQAGVHSTSTDYQRILTVAKATGVGYLPAHVEAVLEFSAAVYKSLGLSIVAGPENRIDSLTFRQVMPDYMNVPSAHIDFNRMSPDTQEFVLLFNKMLLAAEVLTDFNDVPSGLTRMKRGNVLYIVASYKNIQWLVVAKSYFEILNAPPAVPVNLLSGDGDPLVNNDGNQLTGV